MYLLLNNNKYLHQIVESLYFCLKQNNVDCKIIYNIDDVDIIVIKESRMDVIANNHESLFNNLNSKTEIVQPQKKLTIKDISFITHPEDNDINNLNLKTEMVQPQKKLSMKDIALITLPEDNNIKIPDMMTKKKIDSDIYIIFNINSIKDLPKNYIVYNFEQLVTEREWSDDFFKKCKNAIKVLDYSLENIKIFKKKCIEVHHLPFGWCSVLEPDISLENKDIDILFLGSLNKNRLSTINNINNINNCNLYFHNKCFGNDFKMITSKTKIGLNIHFYEGRSILELTRIIPYICAGIDVISERSSDIYYDKIFNHIITFCSKEEMPKVIENSLNNYSLKNILKKKKKLKKRLNFEKIISENINLFNDI